MRLARVSIEGFRSIEKRLATVIDTHVTVLLGANDHGKTNFLDALRLMNREHGFEPDDLNWDCTDRAEELPAIEFELDLNETERRELVQLDIAQRLEAAAIERSVEHEGEIGEIDEAATKADGALKGADEEVEAAAKAANEAREALQADPEGDEAKESYTAAQEASHRAKEVAAEASKTKEELAARGEEASLALALAEARMRQAKGLRESGRLEDSNVEEAAEQAEGAAAAAAKALKKAEGKARGAQAEVDELPEGAEEAARSEPEAALRSAQEEEKAARKASLRAQRAASRERRAAGALAKVAEGNRRAEELDLPVAKLTKPRKAPEGIVVKRVGLKGELEIELCEGIEGEALRLLVARRLPRVELVRPQDHLPDDVSAKGLRDEQNAFMRGIFLYAGIEEADWRWIFTQDSRSRMRLEQASQRLNERLRESWSQGSHLDFQLAHDSKRGRIALEIKDPSVSSRFTKPSQRSGGFTHFFALKTVLHAMQSESRASSYIWLFDEPGIHLHPDGQRDLIQVMETLSQANQVLYTTHSIFLANQNYPTRHRLLLRNRAGTELDSKPFVSRWRTALAALGFSLAGTVLFAPHVLLVEGDSDAIYVTATLRRLIADGHLDADLNRFSAIPTGERQHRRPDPHPDRRDSGQRTTQAGPIGRWRRGGQGEAKGGRGAGRPASDRDQGTLAGRDEHRGPLAGCKDPLPGGRRRLPDERVRA